MTDITNKKKLSLVLLSAFGAALLATSCASGEGDTAEELCVICATEAVCDIATGEAVCSCPAGYSDPGGDGATCDDIDECATNNDDCDDRADCINTLGGYTCACFDGYTGDGVACDDVDECQEDGACDANATCMNYDGAFTCTCNEGYTGDGMACEDIDECAMQIAECDDNATCSNVVGSYECACNEGYTGDGFTCADLDECLLGTGTCEGLLACSNLPGTYECVCPPGYLDEFGDSSSCLIRGAGQAYLIGHDYFLNNYDNNRMLGNAVFSANTTGHVEILAYTEFSDNSAGQEVGSVNAAINARAAELDRTFTLTTFSNHNQLANQLVGKHVLLVYEQESASSIDMINIGQSWALTLTAFVNAGGTVVVTDFDGSTWQILNRSGLMNISSTSTVTSGTALYVLETGHAMTRGVSGLYPATTGTRYYNSDNAVSIVADGQGRSVVLARTQSDDCVTVDDFESGVWPNSLWRSPNGLYDGEVTMDASFDFFYGVRDPGWHYEVDVTAGEVGERVRAWVRLSQIFSAVNLGFGATETGAYSVSLSKLTNQLQIQTNANYQNLTTVESMDFPVTYNKWYLLEAQFGGGGAINVRVYEEMNANPLAALNTTINGLSVGGVAIRATSYSDIDSPEVCPAP